MLQPRSRQPRQRFPRTGRLLETGCLLHYRLSILRTMNTLPFPVAVANSIGHRFSRPLGRGERAARSRVLARLANRPWVFYVRIIQHSHPRSRRKRGLSSPCGDRRHQRIESSRHRHGYLRRYGRRGACRRKARPRDGYHPDGPCRRRCGARRRRRRWQEGLRRRSAVHIAVASPGWGGRHRRW